ncbi:MAG: hypothetical protein A2096_10275 [Spirochaetes bacterium GWF1_41_5]|nr:MAG: hypothetical protein A2096_10275 [Spirochaetes bacterium GWF1_41_5]HBE02626.1 hypothetical protein [Spirochaetia bacterium]
MHKTGVFFLLCTLISCRRPDFSLTIKTDPSGAQVFINDTLAGISPLKLNLSPGPYRLRCRMENYIDYYEESTIISHTGRQIILQPRTGSLIVRSRLAPEKILFASNEIPLNTACSFPTGVWQLQAWRSGMKKISLPVEINFNRECVIDLQFQPIIRPGSLEAVSIPSGADVILDGYRNFKTPFLISIAEPGYHELVFRKNGFKTEVRTVTVPERTRTRTEVTLDPVPGKLKIISQPALFTAVISGPVKQITRCPAEIMLPPGSYQARAQAAGYVSGIFSFDITPGETACLILELQKIYSILPAKILIPVSRYGYFSAESCALLVRYDNIFYYNSADKILAIFTIDGNLRYTEKNIFFNRPIRSSVRPGADLAILSEFEILISDNMRGICKISLTPRFETGKIGMLAEEITGPCGITADASGLIYISDRSGKISVLHNDLQKISQLGGLENTVSGFDRPGLIRIYGNNIYIHDRMNKCLKIFDLTGKHTGTCAASEKPGIYSFFDISRAGLFLYNSSKKNILQYDYAGNFIGTAAVNSGEIYALCVYKNYIYYAGPQGISRCRLDVIPGKMLLRSDGREYDTP